MSVQEEPIYAEQAISKSKLDATSGIWPDPEVNAHWIERNMLTIQKILKPFYSEVKIVLSYLFSKRLHFSYG